MSQFRSGADDDLFLALVPAGVFRLGGAVVLSEFEESPLRLRIAKVLQRLGDDDWISLRPEGAES